MARGGRRRRGVERDRRVRKCGPRRAHRGGYSTRARRRRRRRRRGNPFDARSADDDARLEVFAIRTVAGDVNRREIATFPRAIPRARARVRALSVAAGRRRARGRRRRLRGRATRTARPRLRRRRRRTPRHPRRLHARLLVRRPGKTRPKIRSHHERWDVRRGGGVRRRRVGVSRARRRSRRETPDGRGGRARAAPSARVWCRTRGRDPRAEPRNSSYFVAGPSSRARRPRGDGGVSECASARRRGTRGDDNSRTREERFFFQTDARTRLRRSGVRDTVSRRASRFISATPPYS